MFTKQELEFLLQVINNVPIKGVEASRMVVQVAAKIGQELQSEDGTVYVIDTEDEEDDRQK